MQTTVKNAADVLTALKHTPAAALVPFDGDAATQDRVHAAFEAMAPNTRRAYGSALRTWARWAAAQQVSGLCPAPSDLRIYLLERSASGAGVSSLTVFVSALRKLQALAAAAPTARDQLVADTLSGFARQAASPRQVSALTVGALAAIYETACLRRIGRGGALESADTALRRGLTDIALCWVLSDAGLRRSEAAALTWDDITRWDNGSGRLTVRRSKTDAGPRTVYLTPVAMAHLDAIRPQDADGADAVFGLSVASISRRVKAAARAAGLGAGYSGHSGRVGMARRMARAGAPTHEIMAQGRWKSAGMVADYTRNENAERAAKWLG